MSADFNVIHYTVPPNKILNPRSGSPTLIMSIVTDYYYIVTVILHMIVAIQM